jgi:hypothetical protein
VVTNPKELNEILPPSKSVEKDILNTTHVQDLAEDYGFKITAHGIEINAMKLFKVIFASINMDRSSADNLLDIMIGLYRNIPEARSILKIFLDIHRGNKKAVFVNLAGLLKSLVTNNKVKLQKMMDSKNPYNGVKVKMDQA